MIDTPPVFTQVPVVPEPPKKSYKWLIVAVIALSLSTASVFAYKYWQIRQQLVQAQASPRPVAALPSPSPETTDLTANWKSYTNTEEGFSIKFPNTWEDPIKTPLSTRINYSFVPSNLDITIGFYYDQTLQRPRTYEEEVAAEEKDATGKKNMIIGTVNKTIYVNSIGQSTTEETILFKGKGQNIIWITMPFPSGTDPSIFNLILSTFRFTDPSEATLKVKDCYAKTQCSGGMPCMANPAAVFCICMDGKLEIRENDQGQAGFCLIDGQEYDEWEYFRTKNNL